MKRTLLVLLFGLSAPFAPAGVDADKPPSSEAETARENLTAAQILNSCTRLLPTDSLLLSGEIRVRKPHGVVLDRFPYKLMLAWGEAVPTAEMLLLDAAGTSVVRRAVLTRPAGRPSEIRLFEGAGQKPAETPTYAARIQGTDITWMDLTLDFLWWKDARFDDVPRGDSRNGRDCDILVTVPPEPIPGCSAVRVWVDRKLRCIMQAEQLGPQGNAVRRFWVQRVKKMDERWMIKDMEVETINSGHRTQLLVDDVSQP